MAFFRNDCSFDFNSFLGWGFSTLALRFLNKRSSSDSEPDPDSLNVTQTKLGNPIPVVLGTSMVKSPLIAYYGDFEAVPYTEEYAAHANFNAWPLVIALIAQYIAAPSTTTGTATTNTGVWPIAGKDVAVGPLINTLFMWLLSWLINGRNLKTTIQKGFKYYLGYQQIVCWSHKNARLKRVYMNEEKVWEGDEPASNHTDGSPFVISVNDENLFGGPDENGGFVGELHVYFGGENQGADQWMINQMSADSVQEELRGYTPAYRPFISVVVPKAYVGKRATIPTMWYEIEIIPNGLNEVADDIGLNGIGSMKIGNDANAGDILNEILTNRDWGLAESYTEQNIESLLKIAQKLKDEEVGLSIQLTSKEEARSIVDNICSHINGIRYSDETTGKVTYRLIRDDYLTDDTVIKEVNPSNCSKITFVRQDWSNTVSEMSVTFTDRDDLYETGTVTDDDIANIEIQNGIKTTKTYDYPYFTTTTNALWAAKRKLTQEGYPLANVSLELNRFFYDIRLGDVIKINFPPYGVENMIFRVNNVSHADLESGVISVDAIEDVFALSKTIYNYSDSTEWERNPIYPTGAQYFDFIEMPYEVIRTELTYVYAFCCQPDKDTTMWNVWRKPNGGTFKKTNKMSKWSATGKIVFDYPIDTDDIDYKGLEIRNIYGLAEFKEEMLLSATSGMASARDGSHILMVGDEIMSFADMTQLANGNWLLTGVIRGTYDTVAQPHAELEQVFILESGHFASVTAGGWVASKGCVTTESYNITTETLDGEEDFSAEKIKTLTTTRRTERPSVQGKVRISALAVSNERYPQKLAGDIVMTWADRDNRRSSGCVAQSDDADYYSGAEFTKQDGVEYITEVWVNGSKIHSETAGDENVFNYSWADRCNDCSDLVSKTKIVTYSHNTSNDLDSYQKQEREFLWTIPTIVGTVENEEKAVEKMKSMDTNGQVELIGSAYTERTVFDYSDAPIILLSTRSSGDGAVLDENGDYWIPSGEMVIFTNKDTYTKVSMANGYTLFNAFKYPDRTKRIYMEWNGNTLVETEVNS